MKGVDVVRRPELGDAAGATGPTEFLYANEASTPLAISKTYALGDPRNYPTRRLLWRWARDGRFHGPEALIGFEPTGTDGRFVYLQHSEGSAVRPVSEHPSMPVFVSNGAKRFFSWENGNGLQEIHAPRGSGVTLRFVAERARNGFGPILTSERPDPDLPERALQERWAAAGTELTPFKGYRRIRFSFPSAGLEVAADDRGVDLDDRVTKTRLTVATPNRDDFSGIESVSLDRYGWLFVENGGADYAIKLSRSRQTLKVDRVVEYTGRGWLSRLISFLFGLDRRVRIDERRYSPQCANQSAVLRLTFFCKPFRALRHGSLAKVRGLPGRAERWIGDATGAKVALVAADPAGLYATDGYDAQQVSRLNFRLSAVHDVPTAGRTFVTSGGQAWELVGRYPNLRLQRVVFPRVKDRVATTVVDRVRFIGFPGASDVLAIHSGLGIWLMSKNNNRMLWGVAQSSINLDSVARADVWHGLAFLTADHRPYLISRCNGPRKI